MECGYQWAGIRGPWNRSLKPETKRGACFGKKMVVGPPDRGLLGGQGRSLPEAREYGQLQRGLAAVNRPAERGHRPPATPVSPWRGAVRPFLEGQLLFSKRLGEE